MNEIQLDEKLLQYPDRVAEFFTGKTIFVTGGSGLLGKVLIEKLLRRCSDVKKIYILLRPKKGKDSHERIKDLFANPLFDLLKTKKSEEFIWEKVEVIPGDAEKLRLGISDEDRAKLINEVEIIYHCAATVRFDDTLRRSILLNVRGTKCMLELAKEFKKLVRFCHISTAYSHPEQKVLEEKAYPPPGDPHEVIKLAEVMTDERFEIIKDKLLGTCPNTYTFSKALAESLVVNEMENLPIMILRPSVVIPIWREPLPGWTDNINGPTGLLIGAGKGVIRTMYCKGDICADYLPADIAVNVMLLSVAGYDDYHSPTNIYNVTSSAEHQVSFEYIIELGRKIVEKKIPLNWVVWYPGGSMKRSRLLHNICFYLFHMLPAIFVDALLFILGFPPVLMRVQKRIARGFEVFEYYANNEWIFVNDESRKARALMNPREAEVYKVDGDDVDYEEYFTKCVHAARLYILHESDDTIPTARRHMKVMWCVDKICKALIIFGLTYFLYNRLVAPLLED